MFCCKCGTELPDGVQFCPKCEAARVGTTAASLRPTLSRKNLAMFFAVAGVIAGIVILLALPYDGYFWDHAVEALIGVLFLSAGLTYFWKHSRFNWQ